MKKFGLQILRLLCVLLLIFSSNILCTAEENPPSPTSGPIDNIIDTLEGITCETDGIGNLLRTEFAHTCIPASFASFAIMNIISPGLYANTLLRLNMNDDELFVGACTRDQKVDFNDLKISFSLCNNTKLAVARGVLVGEATVAIGKSLFTGDPPWDDIKASSKLSKNDYHIIERDIRENQQGVMLDIGAIPVFPWKVIRINDKLCVATFSFGGWIPIGCKYIKEPFPISIYSEFLDSSSEGIAELDELASLTTCGNMGSCYNRAQENSRAAVVMTGPIIECVKEMAAKLMISNAVCSFDDVEQVLGSNSRHSSALFQFQQNMHKAVSALLIIYVILFGFKILLAGDIPPKSELIIFVIKFIFVIYFSVGININVGSADGTNRMDGMIEWVFPFLLNGMNVFASWIINASPSELCKFDDVFYPESLQHLRLWDSLDCRVSHYLGLDALQSIAAGGADNLNFPIPPYIYLLVPAIISGIPALISLAIMYPLLVISVAAFVVSTTVISIISIVILGVLAPIFVPLYLFEYTKGYFNSWVKLLISFTLQPMVVVVFMLLMFSVYDFGFYGTCKYGHRDFETSGKGIKITFSGSLGSASIPLPGSRNVRHFFVEENRDSYDTDEEFEGCRDSLGFMLNNPFQFITDKISQNNSPITDPLGAISGGLGGGNPLDAISGGGNPLDIINNVLGDNSSAEDDDIITIKDMPWAEDVTGEEDKKRFNFLEGIKDSPGMLFNTVEIIFEKIRKLVVALFTSCFILYLMYNFSASLAEFAADMTGGVSTSGMGIKAQSIYKAGMAVAGAAAGAAGGGGAEGAGAPGDSVSTSRGGASDKFLTGGGKDGDTVSTGVGSAAVKLAADKVLSSMPDPGKTAESAAKGEDKDGGDSSSKGKPLLIKDSSSDEGEE